MNQLVTNLATKSAVDNGVGLLGRIGNLDVRLTRDAAEISAAQRVRYEVFCAELPNGSNNISATDLDHDAFDQHCDHLIVLDRAIDGPDVEKIIGTYRLMQGHHAARAGGFYSASEFAVAGLVTRHAKLKFLELGRSCVKPEYRSKRTIELLWQGIWAYSRKHNIDVMMGCASFPGIVPEKHAEALSFLHAHALATEEWCVTALPGRHVSMDIMPAEAIQMRSALSALPPLIKGYLRLGAMFGDGAVIDHAFNTTDVLVVLPVEKISSRYRAHFGENADRFAG